MPSGSGSGEGGAGTKVRPSRPRPDPLLAGPGPEAAPQPAPRDVRTVGRRADQEQPPLPPSRRNGKGGAGLGSPSPLSISDGEGPGVRPRGPGGEAVPLAASPRELAEPPTETESELLVTQSSEVFDGEVEGDEEDYAPPPSSAQPVRLGPAARRYATVIEQTLAEFGVPVRVVHGETWPHAHPSRGRAWLRPAAGSRRSTGPPRAGQGGEDRRPGKRPCPRTGSNLPAHRSPGPGKSYIGVEVPNPNPKAVPLPPLFEEPDFQSLASRGVLPFALGRGVSGPPIVADLARLPHLLIAGATGSGKSVAVNSLIGAILQTRTPTDVRIVVVDPKRVEFTWLDRVPHLLTPVVTEPDRAVDVLGKVESEMAHRYDLLAAAGCRNRLSYNAKGHQPLPALVVVVDELADLMMLASDDVERSICRIAQLGRAAGIHLVIATQRPSVDVITGLIKANLPARLAFAVSSLVDSRTILDTPGAERLLGRGDFLYLPPDAMRSGSRPGRVGEGFLAEGGGSQGARGGAAGHTGTRGGAL